LKNGLELNENLNRLTRFKFNKHLGRREFHYKNLADHYLQGRQWLKGLFYFHSALFRSFIENRIADFPKKNWVFTKNMVKLLLKIFSPKRDSARQ